MIDIENMTIEELKEFSENPPKDMKFGELVYLITKLNEMKRTISKEAMHELTFWEKVKSLFSRKPVYTMLETEQEEVESGDNN